jgi:uncharacterized protein YutE (UPF0331/DUF86 family)
VRRSYKHFYQNHMSEIKDLVDRIIADGTITPKEHEELLQQMYKDKVIDEEESDELARIFKLIKEGKVVLEK